MNNFKMLITGGSGFIGTNLIDKLIEHKVVFINIDKSKPNKSSHISYWKQCDILNFENLLGFFNEFKPTHIIHLAARTDTDSNILDDYIENIQGTRNILEIVKRTKSVVRLIITSTQFVNQYHGVPKNDEDYAAHTVYGESKIINEKDIRKAGLNCVWTIIRPTNIWGPWHKRYPFEFWKVLAEKKYIHPGKKKIVRSYGYVGNVIWQVMKILVAPSEVVDRKVYYVGDYPIELYNWVDAFSKKQIGKNVLVVPTIIVKTLALIGQSLKLIGIKFPLTFSRYKSMTTSNDAPMQPVFDAFGTPPYSMEEGIDETITWLKVCHPNLIKLVDK